MATLLGDPFGIQSSISGAIGAGQAAAPILNERRAKAAELQRAEDMKVGGAIMLGASVVNQAIGAYYAAEATKYQLKSQASALDFQAEISRRNASMAQSQAADIMVAGQREVGRLTMQRGQEAAQARARVGARGIQGGVGSVAEVAASEDVIKQIEVLTMNSNTVRAAGAARMQSTNYQAQALAQRTSAQNMRRTAGVTNAYGQIAGTLLGGAGELTMGYAQTLPSYRRRRSSY